MGKEQVGETGFGWAKGWILVVDEKETEKSIFSGFKFTIHGLFLQWKSFCFTNQKGVENAYLWPQLRLSPSAPSLRGANVICLCRLCTIPWVVAPKSGLGEINNSVCGGGFEQCAASSAWRCQLNTPGKGKYGATAHCMVDVLLTHPLRLWS